jgi:hypothetical protein
VVGSGEPAGWVGGGVLRLGDDRRVGGFGWVFRGVVVVPRWVFVLVGGGKRGRGGGGEASPVPRWFPGLVPRIRLTVSVVGGVAVGECVGDVPGADDAVTVGFADLDAVVGEGGFEVGETPALVDAGVELG